MKLECILFSYYKKKKNIFMYKKNMDDLKKLKKKNQLLIENYSYNIII